MKRSEMINNIYRQIIKVDPSLDDIGKRRLQHVINTTIGLAEGNGMAPPPTKHQTYPVYLGDLEWEQENED